MNEIGQDETFYVVWDFLVCFSVRLVRKVLLKEVTFDPGKWVKHLASIVACTPRVPLEVGVGCLKASKITRMTYLLPILIHLLPFSTSKGGLDSKRKLFPHISKVHSLLQSSCLPNAVKWRRPSTRTQGMGWLHARSPKAATSLHMCLHNCLQIKSKCVEPRALFTPRY